MMRINRIYLIVEAGPYDRIIRLNSLGIQGLSCCGIYMIRKNGNR